MTVFCRSLLDDITNASIFSSILINLAEKTYNSDYILKAYIERAKIYYIKPSEEDISRIKDYIDKIDGNIPQELAIETYKCLGDLYSISSTTDAESYYKKALECALTKFGEESLEYVEIEEAIGKILIEKKDIFNATNRFKKSLNIKKKLLGEKSIPVADTYAYMGRVFSTNYFFKALDIYKELLGDTHKKTIEIKETIANLYFNNGRNIDSCCEKAILLYKELIGSLILKDRLFYNMKIALFQENIGHSYYMLKKYADAIDYYKQSLETKFLFTKDISPESNAQSSFYIGRTQLYQVNIEEGLTNIGNSLKYMEEKYENGDSNLIEHLNRIISILEDVIRIHHNKDKAAEALEQALENYRAKQTFMAN